MAQTLKTSAVPINAGRASAFERFSRGAGISSMVVGVLVLIGWAFDIAVLKSLLPIWVTMKANTAAGFLLAGASLFLFHFKRGEPKLLLAGQLCAGVIVLLGAATLSQYFTGVDLSIDQLFFREPANAVAVPFPGRMAPMTAFNFLIIGSALLSLYRGRSVQGAAVCAGIALVSSLAACLGYLYNVEHLYGMGAYATMALLTAMTFTLLCLGIFFARPKEGFMAIAASDSAGGVVLRRFVPLMAGSLIILGWLRLLGQRMGFYTEEFGVGLLVLSSILVLGVLMWRDALLLLRLDLERQAMQSNLYYSNELVLESSRQRMKELARTDEGFRSVVESAQDAIISADSQGAIVFWNPKAQALFGYAAEEIQSKPLVTIIPERFRGSHEAGLKRFTSTGVAHVIGKTVELAGLRKDGREFPIELSLSAWKVKEAGFFTAIIRDITQRRQHEANIGALKQQVKTLQEQLALKKRII